MDEPAIVMLVMNDATVLSLGTRRSSQPLASPLRYVLKEIKAFLDEYVFAHDKDGSVGLFRQPYYSQS